MKRLINKLPIILVLLLVTVIPFQAFFLTWIKYLGLTGNIFTFISLWKEIILVLLVLSTFYAFLKRKDKKINFWAVDKTVLFFIGICFVYFIFSPLPFGQKMAGFRYDTEFLFFYLSIRFLKITKEQLKLMIYCFLGSSLVAIFFGLLQISFLPPSFLESFGYSRNLEVYRQTGIISTYESINPLLPNIYRIQSFFPGSIQFGSYLIVIISLCLSLFFYFKRYTRAAITVLAALAIWALYASHTRSAWIGMAIAFVFLCFTLIRSKKGLLVIGLTSLLIVFLGVVMFFKNPTFQTILLHGEIREGQLFGSTQAHFEALLSNIDLFKNNLLGRGVGFAGPASRNTLNAVITENWYLQIGLEIGIIGLLSFLSVLGMLIFKLLSIRTDKDGFEKYLAVGLAAATVGVSISASMLHTFADTATIYPLFIFMGALFSLNSHKIN